MEPISEERCIFSGRWPEKDRWALRDTIEILPLEDNHVCNACFSAVGRKNQMFGGPSQDPLTVLSYKRVVQSTPRSKKRPNGKYELQHFAITYGRGMTWQNAPEVPP